jgi:hypothetical protein
LKSKKNEVFTVQRIADAIPLEVPIASHFLNKLIEDNMIEVIDLGSVYGYRYNTNGNKLFDEWLTNSARNF